MRYHFQNADITVLIILFSTLLSYLFFTRMTLFLQRGRKIPQLTLEQRCGTCLSFQSCDLKNKISLSSCFQNCRQVMKCALLSAKIIRVRFNSEKNTFKEERAFIYSCACSLQRSNIIPQAMSLAFQNSCTHEHKTRGTSWNFFPR